MLSVAMHVLANAPAPRADLPPRLREAGVGAALAPWVHAVATLLLPPPAPPPSNAAAGGAEGALLAATLVAAADLQQALLREAQRQVRCWSFGASRACHAVTCPFQSSQWQ